jgi:prepilin-type N-terminal cleavage/methylation domain-containing protein
MTSLFPRKTSRRGFTLIELLLVIGIIAILAAIVIVAINPTKQPGDTRNATRRVDVNTILKAVWQYSIDHGTLPSTITTTPTIVCQSDLDASACTAIDGINLRMLSGTYIVSIPKDPLVTSTGTGTRYHVSKDATTGRVTVSAPGAEQGATISVSR